MSDKRIASTFSNLSISKKLDQLHELLTGIPDRNFVSERLGLTFESCGRKLEGNEILWVDELIKHDPVAVALYGILCNEETEVEDGVGIYINLQVAALAKCLNFSVDRVEQLLQNLVNAGWVKQRVQEEVVRVYLIRDLYFQDEVG